MARTERSRNRDFEVYMEKVQIIQITVAYLSNASGMARLHGLPLPKVKSGRLVNIGRRTRLVNSASLFNPVCMLG